MDNFDHKNSISIIDIANQYGAETKSERNDGAVATRNNPLRIERNSSLFLYPSSNTFHDFGDGSGGDVCDFVMIVENCTFKEAIEKLKSKSGFTDLSYTPRRVATKPTTYMQPDIVKKVFDTKLSPLEIDNKDLKDVIPQYAIDYLLENKTVAKDFFSKLRYHNGMKTIVVGIYEDNKLIGFRYRSKTFADDEVRKWTPESNMRSSVPYLNDYIDSFCLVVEGTHDFITADSLGLSCIGLPNAGFKLDAKFLEGKNCLFIPDNDEAGIKGMDKTIAHCGGSGSVFNHTKFAEDNNIKEQKDFSDYSFLFNSRDDFIKAIKHHIDSLGIIKTDINQIISSRGNHLTREYLASLEEIDYIIDSVIPRGLFTIIVGDSGAGKTSAVLSLANKAFADGRIEKLVVLDADMPPVLLRDRINILMDKNGDDSIRYFCNGLSDSDDMVNMIDALSNAKADCSKVLFIIDTLKDFVNSPNDEKTIQIFMNKIKALRNNTGATIIMLHHVKKQNQFAKELEYTGSNAIKASADEFVYLYRKAEQPDIVNFMPSNKTRCGLIPAAFKIDHLHLEIEDADFIEYMDEDEKPTLHKKHFDEEKLIESLLEFVKENDGCLQQDSITHLKGLFPIRKIRDAIFNKKDELWRFSKGMGHAYHMHIINKEPVVTEYKEDNYNIDSFELF